MWCQLCGNYLGHRTLHLTLTSPIRLRSSDYDDDDGYDDDDDCYDDGYDDDDDDGDDGYQEEDHKVDADQFNQTAK